MDGSLFELDERGNVIPSEDDSQGEVYEDEELSMADEVLVNDVVIEIVKLSKDKMNERMQDLRIKVSWLRTEIMALECEMDELSKEYRKGLLRG